jgi:hypothetical protein
MTTKHLAIVLIGAAAVTSHADYNFNLRAQANIFFQPPVQQVINETNTIRSASNFLVNHVGGDYTDVAFGAVFGTISGRVSIVAQTFNAPSSYLEVNLSDRIVVDHPFGQPVTLRFHLALNGGSITYTPGMQYASMNGILEVGGVVRSFCEYGKVLNDIRNVNALPFEQTFASGSAITIRNRMILRAIPGTSGVNGVIDYSKGLHATITPVTQGGSITSDSGASYSLTGTKIR